MWVKLIHNEYDFLLILNSYVCRIRHIIGYGRNIPKWIKQEILLWVWVWLWGMGGIFQNGINRKYCCGFGCGCGFAFALTIGAATDAASATAATTIIVTAISFRRRHHQVWCKPVWGENS
jgi:hypothetical protein